MHITHFPAYRHDGNRDFVAKPVRVRMWLTHRSTTLALGVWVIRQYTQFEWRLPKFIGRPLKRRFERLHGLS